MSTYRFCPRCGSPLVDRDLGGALRRGCPAESCGFVFWDNPVPVVAALVEVAGQIVLARNAAWPTGQFGLVTGFLERNESPAAAVAREVKEELDLDASSVALIGVYPFTVKNELILAYHVVADGRIRLNEELAEIRLISPERLKAWDFGTGLAVADWLRGRLAGA